MLLLFMVVKYAPHPITASKPCAEMRVVILNGMRSTAELPRVRSGDGALTGYSGFRVAIPMGSVAQQG